MPGATSRSWSCPRAARSATGSSGWPRGRTTTSRSRSRRPSWWPASGRSSAAPSATATSTRGERLAIADLELDPGRYTATVAGRPIDLSALEVRLLWALLDANGRVLSRDALLDAIHGDGEGDITDRAIDQYVKRLREKLGDDPAAPRYVATVRGVGYRAAGAVTRSETPG